MGSREEDRPPDGTREEGNVLLEDQKLRQKLLKVFHEYDKNKDEKLSYKELYTAIRHDKNIKISKAAIYPLWLKADSDCSDHLSFEEFLQMVKENQSIFGHLGFYMTTYVNTLVPQRRPPTDVEGDSDWEHKGDYEKQFSCLPPALGMLLVSLMEIGLFVYDWAAYGETLARGPVASALIFDPYRRYEAWRYVTYMFVHVGHFHLLSNLVIQIMLGIPLEMVHRSWRVGLVYVAGVLAGSLGTSITSPRVYLAGASGGVYALIAAHLANVIMNWHEMRFAVHQLLAFLIWAFIDVRSVLLNRHSVPDNKVGLSSHMFGAAAGLLAGIIVLRNINKLPWERRLQWASIAIYVAVMVSAVAWSLAATSYFPPPRY